MNLQTETKTELNLGKRILAGIIDYGIILTITIVLTLALGELNDENGYTLNGLPALIPIIFWGIMTIGLEQLFGATLGNYAVDLKPVPINSVQNKITFGQSLKRHLLDPIDMFFFGIIGIITIKNTENNQRLGDIWAKTIIVKTN